MFKRKRSDILVLILISLLFISSCKVSNPDTQSDSQIDVENIDFNEFNLGVCKSKVKAAQLEVNNAERAIEKERLDLEDAKADLAEAKKYDDQEKIDDKGEEIKEQEASIKEAESTFETAKESLSSVTKKCNTLSTKADKKICQEFQTEISTELTTASANLQKYQTELGDIDSKLQDAKDRKQSLEVIAEWQKQKDEQNLRILKENNMIDRLNSWQTELNTYCS